MTYAWKQGVRRLLTTAGPPGFSTRVWNTIQEKVNTVKTFSPKPNDLSHEWYVVDATDVVLGRLSVAVANLLRGKNKPSFAPHADAGNHVIVLNADKISLSRNKLDKNLYHHSGFPSGLRADSYAELLKSNPERIVTAAVKGMMPKNKLSRKQLTRLHVYRGEEHPHTPNKPVAYEIDQVSQQAK